MKPENAERAAILVRARLEIVADLEKGLERDAPENGYTRRVVSIETLDAADSGGHADYNVEIDILTGRKLVPLLKQLIDDELRAIGVEIKEDDDG